VLIPDAIEFGQLIRIQRIRHGDKSLEVKEVAVVVVHAFHIGKLTGVEHFAKRPIFRNPHYNRGRGESLIVSRLLRATAIVLTCALAACAAPQVTSTPTPLPKAPTPVPPTYRVETGQVIKRIQFPARVQPKDSAQLYFETDGRILSVGFKEGDAVKQGDVLAALDVADLRNELDQREVELRTAQTVLSNTLQNYTRTLTLAKLEVDQSRLRLAIANEQAEGAGVRLAESELARHDKLIADITASIQQAREAFDQAGADNAAKLLDQAQFERTKLQAALDRAIADQKVKQLEAQLLHKDVERAQLNYETVLSNVDPSLISAVERARLALEGVQQRLSRSQLVAPFDGVIAQQTARVGSNVRALDPVIVLAKPGELELVATLTPIQSSDVDISQPVTCFFEAAPNDARAGIVRAFQRMAPNATNQLVNILLNDNGPLEVSRAAQCNTVLGQENDVLWLPPSAIRSFQGRRFVVIQDLDGKQRRVDVEIGLQADDRVQIKSGLNEGDVIIAP
jgi:RND family efflux transporter MFP subunit